MLPGSEHQRWFSIEPPERPRPPILAANLLIAAAGVALCAQVSVPVPGSEVPQSLQTLAVVLAGMWLGPVWGPAAMVVYVAAGLGGLPVFADGASGLEVLTGPTGGYLGGFVLGAGVSGAFHRRAWISPWIGMAWMAGLGVVGHVVILTAGWLRLGQLIGFGEAFAGGVEPFLWGGVAKSVAAAVVWMLVELSRPPQ